MKNNTIDKETIKKAVKDILVAIGEDPDREGLLQTPDRVAPSVAQGNWVWRAPSDFSMFSKKFF